MLRVSSILGLDGLSGKEDSGIVLKAYLTKNVGEYLVGSPVFLDETNLDRYMVSDDRFKAISIYGNGRNGKPFSRINIRPSIIHIPDNPYVFERSKLQYITAKIPAIKIIQDIALAKKGISTTYLFGTRKEAVHFIENGFNSICNSHKFSSVYFSVNNNNFKKFCTYFAVTFLNIKDCVAIYNNKRVDGVVVMATLLSESGTIVEKRPYFSFNMSLVLTNYKDNVFVVDGAPITPINDIKDTNVKTAIHTEITKQLPIKIKADKSMRNMETALKEKEKKNKKQSLHISDGTKPTSSRPWGTYNTSAGTTATPTSTTTLYYNTNS